MLRKTTAWTDSKGSTHATLEDAQAAEIEAVLELSASSGPAVAQSIVKHKDRIVDILTTTERSLPSARKLNGGSKKRLPKVVAPAQTVLAKAIGEKGEAAL